MKNDDLIFRSALKETMFQNEPVERFHPQENKMWQECFGFIENAPAVDAVEVGSCAGCHWKEVGRQQKCSCCRRNRYMKDNYRRSDDG